MMTRWLAILLALSGSLLGCGDGDPRPSAADLRLAVQGSDLWIVLVDAGAAEHFSFCGYDRATTPNLSALAARSVVFENAYAQASATPLSCYSWMTSRYPHMQNAVPSGPEMAAIIGPQVPTLATRLSPIFPARGAIVANQWIARRLGFDTGFTYFDEAFSAVTENRTANAEFLAHRTLDWWSRTGERRLTYTHFLEPHEPYTPPEPYASMFDREVRGLTDGTRATLDSFKARIPSPRFLRNTVALYDGNLAYVDAQIGALVDSLKVAGRWGNTTMVLLSDHGEAFWQHGERGHGAHIYEEYVRVPLFVRFPETAEVPPQRVPALVQLVDIVPTLTDLYAIPASVESMAGRSLVPLLCRDLPDTLGRSNAIVFFRNHDGARVELGVRQRDYKYQHFYQRKLDELYDLASDPGETRNLLRSTPPPRADTPSPVAIARDLFAKVRAWVDRGPGVSDGSRADSADLEELSPEERARLKALGYFE